MSRNYKFHNPEGTNFVSFVVVEWLDVYTRNEYKNIIVDSLQYCQKEKGMEIFAWCIMTKHIHLVYRSVSDQKPESILGDFKRFTSKPIELWSNKVIDEKINYIHNNPVEQGLVFRPEDYIYSSAIDYSGEKGILDDVVIK